MLLLLFFALSATYIPYILRGPIFCLAFQGWCGNITSIHHAYQKANAVLGEEPSNNTQTPHPPPHFPPAHDDFAPTRKQALCAHTGVDYIEYRKNTIGSPNLRRYSSSDISFATKHEEGVGVTPTPTTTRKKTSRFISVKK